MSRTEGENSVSSAGWVVCSAVLKKINFQENCQYWRPASVMLPCEFMKTILEHGNLPRNVSIIFGIFICLVSQIIIVLIGQRQANYLSNFVENTCKMSWMPKRNRTSPRALVMNCFAKFNKFRMTAPWWSPF